MDVGEEGASSHPPLRPIRRSPPRPPPRATVLLSRRRANKRGGKAEGRSQSLGSSTAGNYLELAGKTLGVFTVLLPALGVAIRWVAFAAGPWPSPVVGS